MPGFYRSGYIKYLVYVHYENHYSGAVRVGMIEDELIVNPGRNKVTALLEYISCYSIVW